LNGQKVLAFASKDAIYQLLLIFFFCDCWWRSHLDQGGRDAMMTMSHIATVSSVGANEHDADHKRGDRGRKIISLLQRVSERKRTTRTKQDHNRISIS
jgi:hypothetical protein